MKILLIEDDKKIAHSLKDGLIKDYTVDIACSGKKGIFKALTNDYDLIILDLNLPDSTGLAVCQDLRREGVEIPILILTAENSTANKVVLLNAGADDYVVKPFYLSEVKARLTALLRRKSKLKNEILTINDISLNPQTKSAFFRHQPLQLTPKEFFLLEYFLHHPDQILNRLQLAEHIWEGDPYVNSNAIDVHICNLRNKIGPKIGKEIIKTAHGSGYMLKAATTGK